MPVPCYGNGFPPHEALGKTLHVLVHAEDDVPKRSHTVALITKHEETLDCKDLHACGTRVPWVDSALALAKRSSQCKVPNVQVFGRVRLGWPTKSLMRVFRVGTLRNALVLTAVAVAFMGAIPNSHSSHLRATSRA
jgi:hypothetical protein